jgi:hypothetical protein
MVMLLAEARVSAMSGTRARRDARVERSSWEEIRAARSDWATTAVASVARERRCILGGMFALLGLMRLLMMSMLLMLFSWVTKDCEMVLTEVHC